MHGLAREATQAVPSLFFSNKGSQSLYFENFEFMEV
jgi:hypothetical protein